MRARYWHECGNEIIQCDLCPHYCKLKSGQRGLCYVRGNEAGEMILHTYGRSSGFCIDPIEKKPLNHFYPGTPVLSFGTAGCNLSCKFCQNWDISKSRQMDRCQSNASPADIVKMATSNNCRQIAFTYNDPVIFLEYALDVAQLARKSNIKTVAVTAGYINPRPRQEFFSLMDAANVDLKAFSEQFYQKYTGGKLSTVLDTLIYLKEKTNVWLEITTLLIPGANDSPEEIEAECRWIVKNLGGDIPLHFSAFHPDWKMLDIEQTPPATLLQACEIARQAGLNHVYTGNISHAEGASTFCSNCQKLLIARDWYNLGEWNLVDNRCQFCQSELPGHFDSSPGTWGNRRLPLF